MTYRRDSLGLSRRPSLPMTSYRTEKWEMSRTSEKSVVNIRKGKRGSIASYYREPSAGQYGKPVDLVKSVFTHTLVLISS